MLRRVVRPKRDCVTIKKMNMEIDNYRSPEVEIIEMQAEQAILSSSFTGEDINDWEVM